MVTTTTTATPTPAPLVGLSLHSPPLPSPQHGRSPSPRSPHHDDWWRWPTPTREDANNRGTTFGSTRSQRPPLAPPAPASVPRRSSTSTTITAPDSKLLGEWRVGKSIGSGSSGQVRVARSTRSPQQFAAVKKVRKLASSDKHSAGVHREVIIAKLVHHPHLVAIKDVFETTSHLYLITDYCSHGELFEYMLQRQLDPATIWRFFAQLTSALSQLHSMSIAHRDIKFENIFLFLDSDGLLSIKLGDLGMASYQPPGNLLETSCGSPHYAAPEVIAGLPYEGTAADVWSAGVVLYSLHARMLPFDHDHIPTLLARIRIGKYEMSPLIPADAQDLVASMLVMNPEERVTLRGMVLHPYLTKQQGSVKTDFEPSSPTTPSENVPLRAEELDEHVVLNLKLLLRMEATLDVIYLVLRDTEEAALARKFYTILRNFQLGTDSPDHNAMATRRVASRPSAKAVTQPTVIAPSRSSSPSSPRRSLSLPDFPLPPPPSTTLQRPASRNSRPPTSDSRPTSSRRGRPLSPRDDPVPFPTISIQASTRPNTRGSSRPNTGRSIRTLRISNMFGGDATSSAPSQLQRFDSVFNFGPPPENFTTLRVPIDEESEDWDGSEPGGDLRAPATADSTYSSGRSKKQSMPRRLKLLFLGHKLSSSAEHSPVRNIRPGTPRLPSAPRTPPSIPHSNSAPASISPVKGTSVFRRSTGYPNLTRAIGLGRSSAPGSPSPTSRRRDQAAVSELGVLLQPPSMIENDDVPTTLATAEEPKKQTIMLRAKKSWSRRKRASQGKGDEENIGGHEGTTADDRKNYQPWRAPTRTLQAKDRNASAATTACSTPGSSPIKRRPSPLNLVTSNTVFTPSRSSTRPITSPSLSPSNYSRSRSPSPSPTRQPPRPSSALLSPTPSDIFFTTPSPSSPACLSHLQSTNAALERENALLRTQLRFKEVEVARLRARDRSLDELEQMVEKLQTTFEDEGEGLEERWARRLAREVGEGARTA